MDDNTMNPAEIIIGLVAVTGLPLAVSYAEGLVDHRWVGYPQELRRDITPKISRTDLCTTKRVYGEKSGSICYGTYVYPAERNGGGFVATQANYLPNVRCACAPNSSGSFEAIIGERAGNGMYLVK